jgi:hypothetical protein
VSNELLVNFDTEAPQKLYRGACPAGGGTDPAYRIMGTPVSGTAAQVNPTVSASAQAGDLLIAVVQHSWGAGSITPPAGWTQILNTVIGGTFWNIGVFVKTCVAGDIGASTGNFSVPGSAAYVGYVIAYSGWDNTNPIANVVTAAVNLLSSATDTPNNPSAVVDSKYMEVTHYFHGSPSATVTTAPTGMTNRLAATNETTAAIAVYDKADATALPLVWNSSGTVGAINIWIGGKSDGTVASSPTALYTVPANTRTKVTDITVDNTNALSALVSVALGGYDILHTVSIPAGQTLDFSCEQTLLAGDTVTAGASAGTGVNLHVSGRECV